MSLDTIGKFFQIILAGMAIFGIKEWHREFLGRRRIELSEEALVLIYQARDVIRFMRSPLVMGEEIKNAIREPDEEESVFRARCAAAAVAFRFQKHSDIFAALNAMKYQYMARFGSEKSKLFESLDVSTCRTHLDGMALCGRLPPMRQQLGDLVVFLGRQPREHVLQISIRIMPVQPRRLDQAHDGGRALTTAQRPCE